MPDLDLTVETSELLIKPLTVTSVRKFVAFVAVPLRALVWLTSEALTEPLLFVSPSSTPIIAGTLPEAPVESCTLAKVTVVDWALVTPVRLTVYWFAFGPSALLLTDPAPPVTLALATLTRLFGKVKTILKFLLAPPLRHSTLRVAGGCGKTMSKSPALPWVMRETTANGGGSE